MISYTGTPTVVWRRTGEICLVGVEFCLLTEWKKEELVTGRKYIYEVRNPFLSVRFDLNLNLFYSILMSNECWFGLV